MEVKHDLLQGFLSALRCALVNRHSRLWHRLRINGPTRLQQGLLIIASNTLVVASVAIAAQHDCSELSGALVLVQIIAT